MPRATPAAPRIVRAARGCPSPPPLPPAPAERDDGPRRRSRPAAPTARRVPHPLAVPPLPPGDRPSALRGRSQAAEAEAVPVRQPPRVGWAPGAAAAAAAVSPHAVRAAWPGPSRVEPRAPLSPAPPAASAARASRAAAASRQPAALEALSPPAAPARAGRAAREAPQPPCAVSEPAAAATPPAGPSRAATLWRRRFVALALPPRASRARAAVQAPAVAQRGTAHPRVALCRAAALGRSGRG
mmetsp:Transcript_36677/g.109072  ORF Transcript_36677/g.109072 Transcript_36677/m.109072 type:complete len:242 (-) Transcript_36677:240-965(-)